MVQYNQLVKTKLWGTLLLFAPNKSMAFECGEEKRPIYEGEKRVRACRRISFFAVETCVKGESCIDLGSGGR